ncbi:MAG TPA: glycosyltransferase family 39 protein [Ktedonobacterales bacterium]|jgi:4-amino-4-deoxy-L-arabinose transferase-like glycosyltransferase
MGRVEAESRLKAAARGDWMRRFAWSLLLRRATFVLCLLDAMAAESQLSALVKTGSGADRVTASPVLVALLLIASFGAAALLRWQDVFDGVADAWWTLRRTPEALQYLRRLPQTARVWLLSRRESLHALLERWRSALHATTWRHWAGLSLAWIALVLALIASALAGAADPVLAAQWFWFAGMLLLLLAACVWPSAHSAPLHRLHWRLSVGPTSPLWSRWRARWNTWGDWLLLGALLAGGAALRLPNLASMPYVVHGDEASCALEALRWLHGEVDTLLSTGWYGLPMLGYGIPAVVMHFAGDSLFGVRLSSVIVGLLSLIVIYLLAREFAGRRVAFVATALLAVSHLHIQFSRSGIHYIHALFAVELTLWLLVRALRDRSAVTAVLAAIAMSFSAQVYFSARLVFIIVPLFIVGLWLLNRRLLSGRGPTLAWLIAGVLAALGPLASFFRTAGNALNSRTDEVLILNQTPWMRDHLIQQFGTADIPTVLLRQLAAIPLLPTAVADQSTQYGPLYSLLDVGVATLVTIGFFYALLRLRKPVYLLLAIWIVGTVVFGGVLTIDMPDWQRLLVMLPALCLLAALLLEDILERVEQGIVSVADRLPRLWLPSRAPALAATLLALVLVGLSANWNIQRYFVDFPHQTNHDPWWTTYTDIGRYLSTLPADTHFILFSDDTLVADYATLRYLGPGVSGGRVETTDELAQALANSADPTVTIVTLGRVGDLEQALAAGGILPSGSFTPYVTANHTTTFYLYMTQQAPPGSTGG